MAQVILIFLLPHPKTKKKRKEQFHSLRSEITKLKQSNSVVTNSVVNKHFVITNRFLDQIGHFSTQINPVLMSPRYTEQKWPVPSCSLQRYNRVWLYLIRVWKHISEMNILPWGKNNLTACLSDWYIPSQFIT